MKLIPLSLYFHFPWCLSKCPYCDFNSYALSDKNLIHVYGKRLLDDLSKEIREFSGCSLVSVYFGGGTPSLLSPAIIDKILNVVQDNFVCSSEMEITLEANPGTVDLALCQGLKAAGVNRLSLGVQSFCDKNLRNLQRTHNTNQAKDSIKILKKAGFTNFNLDLMFGLPGQTTQNAAADLKIACDFMPPHLSWYQLTLDDSSLAKKYFTDLPQDDNLWDIQQIGHETLIQEGYGQYEVAAYCAGLDNRCQHNLNYWQYGDYLGVGAGACGKVTLSDYLVKRYVKIPQPHLYLRATDFVASREIVTHKQLPLEFMLNALRLYEPITYGLFWERTGCKIDTIQQELQCAVERGFIELKNETIVTTDLGKNFLNDLLEIFATRN